MSTQDHPLVAAGQKRARHRLQPLTLVEVVYASLPNAFSDLGRLALKLTPLIIHYRSAFFCESQQVADPARAIPGMPRGLVGRQVANLEMLRALLRYGRDDELTFLVDTADDHAAAKAELNATLPAGKRAIIKRLRGSQTWLAAGQETVLWEPQPPSTDLARMRHQAGAARIAISGITHALCSVPAVDAVRGLATTLFHAADRLVCTSDAVAHTAESLLTHARGGPQDNERDDQIALETIPLGVDSQRHRPATPEQRCASRDHLGIANDEVAILFVGRLSHHAKSNPLPMFFGCEAAYRRTGHPIVLILAGWYANGVVKKAFNTEARRLAPNVRVIEVNGMDPSWRESVWYAADLFISLADSVQETFGLTVVEAMSRKLPVIATDWNGYRDTVRHCETGLLIPTSIVEGAGERSLRAMHEGRLSYDQFLAAASQTVRVDPHAVADAVSRLVANRAERTALAEKGFQHVRCSLDWSIVIAKYEELWARQRALLRRRNIQQKPSTKESAKIPNARRDDDTSDSGVPCFRVLFQRYPSKWARENKHFEPGLEAFGDRSDVSVSRLASHGAQWRLTDERLETFLDQVVAGDDDPASRTSEFADTLAWAHKYDLIHVEDRTPVRTVASAGSATSFTEDLTWVTTCVGQLDHLKQSLPRLLAQPGEQVIVVDDNCPQNSGEWLRQAVSKHSVVVVSVPSPTKYCLSHFRNRGWQAAQTAWVGFVDADVLLSTDCSQQVQRRMRPGRFLRTGKASISEAEENAPVGLLVLPRQALQHLGGYDPVFRGWGEEEDDLVDALIFHGYQIETLPKHLAAPLSSEQGQSPKSHDQKSLRDRWLTNRVYRLAKWDLSRQRGAVLDLESRQKLYTAIEQQIFHGSGEPMIEVELNGYNAQLPQLGVDLTQKLTYRIDRRPDNQ